MTDLLIYGVPASPFVRKVHVLLTEKGVEYELETLMPFPAPDWYAEINPAKRIPVLRDRSVGAEGVAGTIPDSSAICAYIERKYPQPAMYPSDAFDYGRAIWIEEWADSLLAGPVGMGMFRPMIFPAMAGKDPDVDTARKTLTETLPPLFDWLEIQIGNREFLIGESFGIADISVATHFGNMRHAGGKPDPAKWPKLAEYIRRILDRSSFAETLQAEAKQLPQHGVEL
jgi:glutathione S-transferase